MAEMLRGTNAERIVINTRTGGMASKRFLDKCSTYFRSDINMPLSKRQCSVGINCEQGLITLMRDLLNLQHTPIS